MMHTGNHNFCNFLIPHFTTPAAGFYVPFLLAQKTNPKKGAAIDVRPMAKQQCGTAVQSAL
jgi:hypothetical protein